MRGWQFIRTHKFRVVQLRAQKENCVQTKRAKKREQMNNALCRFFLATLLRSPTGAFSNATIYCVLALYCFWPSMMHYYRLFLLVGRKYYFWSPNMFSRYRKFMSKSKPKMSESMLLGWVMWISIPCTLWFSWRTFVQGKDHSQCIRTYDLSNILIGTSSRFLYKPHCILSMRSTYRI